MLELLFDILFEFLGELVIAVAGQAIVALFEVAVKVVRRRWFVHAAVALTIGGLLGALSTVVVPYYVISHPDRRLFNLAFTPLSTGGLAVLTSHAKQRWLRLRADPRGDAMEGSAAQTFAFAALASFGFSLVRLILLTA